MMVVPLLFLVGRTRRDPAPRRNRIGHAKCGRELKARAGWPTLDPLWDSNPLRTNRLDCYVDAQ